MSTLVYYVAATLDGYIATEQHKLDWLDNFALGDDATPYDDFYETVGAVVMGSQTYDWIMSNAPDDWPYQDVPAFVMSNQDLSAHPNLNITFVKGDARDIAIRARSAAKGKNVWLVGGGKTAACFANAGELQQLFITTIPVFLGSGVPVLPVDHALEVVLRKQRTLKSGAIECVLDVKMD
ncbi:dihydrofolate reductase family protein [Pseudomonas orientalis]|uniref:Dihydrofolate reductase n=1 Tax=Pseudomonas orientalis TaxID=76758 RepID=A0A2L0RYX5_9PSED|nr:dihydrofolate reductase family protein [Pseudomonas orientalis]AUZ47297.1 dihydrofolate reductase [Pseudomonas orientalis]